MTATPRLSGARVGRRAPGALSGGLEGPSSPGINVTARLGDLGDKNELPCGSKEAVTWEDLSPHRDGDTGQQRFKSRLQA